MLRALRIALSLLLPALLCLGAVHPKNTTSKKKPSSVQAAKKTSKGTGTKAVSRSSAKKKASPKQKAAAASTKTSATGKKSRGKSFSRKSKARVAARPRGQQAPTPERYREIQQALAERGYLQGEPSGVWDQESTAALRRFQEDKKIEATGKLSSLSLIYLGLGPKRDGPAQQRTEQQ